MGTDFVSTLSSTGKVSFDINNSLFSPRCLFRVLQHRSCLAKSLVTLSSSVLFLSSPPSFSSQPTLSPTACTVGAFHHFRTINDNVKGPWLWNGGGAYAKVTGLVTAIGQSSTKRVFTVILH